MDRVECSAPRAQGAAFIRSHGRVELSGVPSAHDPGDRSGVVLVVMGDADPNGPRVQRPEQRADALLSDRQSISRPSVQDPCGSAGRPRDHRGAVAHVEDVELEGLRDRAGRARAEGRTRPGEQEHAEGCRPQPRDPSAQVMTGSVRGESHREARQEDEPQGALGEWEWCPGQAVHPLEPGDQPVRGPAGHAVKGLEGQEESEPPGRDEEGERWGGDGGGQEAHGAPLPEDAPDHGEGCEGGDRARGEGAEAEPAHAPHEGDEDRRPGPAGGADGVHPSRRAAAILWVSGEGSGQGACRQHQGGRREVGELRPGTGRGEGVHGHLGEGRDADEVEGGGAAPEALREQREPQPDGGPGRRRAPA